MRLLLPVLLGALSLVGCSRSKMPPLTTDRPGGEGGGVPSDGAVARSEPLSFQVKRYPGGEPYALASDRGSVVLLDVWATWCEPCRDALPFYENLGREYANRGLKVYALNVDEDTRAIAPFLKEVKASLPILLDENAQVSERLLMVRGLPTTYLIDKRGVVRFAHLGFGEEWVTKLQTEIEALLAEPAP